MSNAAKEFLKELRERRRLSGEFFASKEEISMEDATIALKALEKILKCEDLIRSIEII